MGGQGGKAAAAAAEVDDSSEKNQGINFICTFCNNFRHGFRKTSADKDAEVALEEAKPTKKKPTP